MRTEKTRCPKQKVGEYNMLRCVYGVGHLGACAFAVVSQPLNQENAVDKTERAKSLNKTEALIAAQTQRELAAKKRELTDHELVVYYLEDASGKRVVGPFFTREESRQVENHAPALRVVAYDLVRRADRPEGGA